MTKARSATRQTATHTAAPLVAALLGAVAIGLPGSALAFGPLGHRVAGLLAERELCPAAREEVAALGGGESLAELGLWADTIRDEPEWRRSGPWHYMNVADLPRGAGTAEARGAIDAFRHPPEGDVLEALARFEKALANRGRARAERVDALRFVVHFVVDVHQPLHVGRASDRGGNEIEVRVGSADPVSLHHFWDTDVLALRHLGAERYAQRLASAFAAMPAARAHDPPAAWAAESLLLRPEIYGFAPAGRGSARLDDNYLRSAQKIADERLVLAAARLAATLNTLFCGSAAR
ncbi:MAG TPA: S1/P1 nuclease [Gammaproteobacteria bacterium]|nr:S1/P1 nuclease [Gammaproteobacteria bacterium]